MKIPGAIRWTVSGRFSIESDLLKVASEFRELKAEEKPTVLTIVLEAEGPYTVDGVPIVFKMAPKKKSSEGGVTVA